MADKQHFARHSRSRLHRDGQAMIWLMMVLGLAVVGIAVFVFLRAGDGDKLLQRLPAPELDSLSGRATTMVTNCMETVRQQPRDAEAWGLLGRVLLAHHFHEESMVCFETAWDLDPENHKWPYSIVMAMRIPDPKRAIELTRKAIVLSDGDTTDMECRLAEYHFDQGEFDEAKKILSAILDRDPAMTRANMLLARLYLNEQELSKSLEQVNLVLRAQPNRQEALRLASQLYFRLGEPEKSSEFARRSEDPSSINPPWDDRLWQEVTDLRRDVNLMVAAAMQLPPDRIDERIKVLKDAIREEPHEPNWHGFLGQSLMRARRHEEAEPVLENAVQIHPLSAVLHYTLGLVYLHQKKTDLAISSLKKALSIKSDYDAAATDLGIAYREAKQFSAAIQSFDDAIRIFPGNFRARLNRAVVLQLAGQDEAAVEALRQCVAMRENVPDVRFLLAKLLAESPEHHAEARMHLQKVLEQDPDIPGVRELLNSIGDKDR